MIIPRRDDAGLSFLPLEDKVLVNQLCRELAVDQGVDVLIKSNIADYSP